MRSPDNEVVFRVGTSLANRSGFEVAHELEWNWKGFGVAKGGGGRLYSIFGPLESIVIAPLIQAAGTINRTGWYESAGWIPLSHYADAGLLDYLRDRRPENLEPHALRFLVSFFNALVTALSVVLFLHIALRMSRSLHISRVMTVVFAFATLAWPYSGTFFSEPLATLFLLLTFYLLIANDTKFAPGDVFRSRSYLFLAGISLGLAVASHITAILFAPFWGIYLWYACFKPAKKQSQPKPRIFYLFLCGFAIILASLAIYNFLRFGNFLETGRSVGSGSLWRSQYSHFIPPWRGLWALLLSGGKGLLFFCPAVLLGLITWRSLHRRHKVLSLTLGGIMLLRLLFVATRSDWHGGFSLGPRYLLMVIPFMLLPAVFWLEEQVRAKNLKAIGILISAVFICSAQQLYFVIGEIFSFYHLIKWKYASLGIDVFKNDRLYTDWSFSPLIKLLEGKPGPFWLRPISAGNTLVWVIGTILIGIVAVFGFVFLSRGMQKSLHSDR